MDMSLHAEQVKIGQESGIRFRPTIRSDYDEQQWSVAPLTHDANVSSYKPESSRRINDEPPLLRPSNRTAQLSALLTILHSIPLARASLLLYGKQLLNDYGIADKWWDNEIIFIPEFIESEDKQETIFKVHLLAEVQRIIAFLDDDGPSERAYASLDNLVFAWGRNQLNLDVSSLHYGESMAAFLPEWLNIAKDYTESLDISGLEDSLFFTEASLDKEVDTNAVQHETFSTLDVSVTDESIRISDKLLGALDTLLWEEEPDAYLSSVADIFTMIIRQENGRPGAGVDVPLVWYPDRYTKPFQKLMKQNNKQRSQLSLEIERLRQRRAKIDEYSGFNTRSLLKSTIAFYAKDLNAAGNSTPKEIDSSTNPTVQKLKALTTHLDLSINRIDAKIAQLESKLKLLTELFSEPTSASDGGSYPPFQKYVLSGVAFGEKKFYFRNRPRRKSNKVTLIEELDDVSVEDELWLQVSYYDGSSTGSFETKQVRFEHVHEAMRSQGEDGVLVVYASEKALDQKYESVQVPSGLHEFLIKDQDLLDKELQSWIETADLVDLKNVTNDNDHASQSSCDVTMTDQTDEIGTNDGFNNLSNQVVVNSTSKNPVKIKVQHAEHAEDGALNDSDDDYIEAQRSRYL
ncbi:hypothetical protein V1514DRAFT_333549 [Lipomyces japonicus]|uniref:uncharacterized protein n=1 Tax=Lipomyces japonicus TaxID=56871 RepID=UPI0034CD3066